MNTKQILGNIAIALALSVFVVLNVEAFVRVRQYSYLLVALNQTIYVVLFLVRTKAVRTSTSSVDWTIAFLATFLSTLLRPATPHVIGIGTVLIVLGVCVNIASVLFLGRSIGIVPAERYIQTRGIYKYIRHPMYISEILSFIGYCIINTSLINILIVLVTCTLMVIRMRREEKFLSQNKVYKEYMARTPFRLLPYIF